MAGVISPYLLPMLNSPVLWGMPMQFSHCYTMGPGQAAGKSKPLWGRSVQGRQMAHGPYPILQQDHWGRIDIFCLWSTPRAPQSPGHWWSPRVTNICCQAAPKNTLRLKFFKTFQVLGKSYIAACSYYTHAPLKGLLIEAFQVRTPMFKIKSLFLHIEQCYTSVSYLHLYWKFVHKFWEPWMSGLAALSILAKWNLYLSSSVTSSYKLLLVRT